MMYYRFFYIKLEQEVIMKRRNYIYNLENILKKVEHMLADCLKFCDIDTMKKYVNQNFIIDYEELLNQTIFEIYYENYSKYSEREPISHMFKNETEEDIDLASNKDYKKNSKNI